METLRAGELSLVAVTGDQWWVSFPPSQRVITETQGPPPRSSYPETVKAQFQRLTATNAMMVATQTVNHLPCWNYEVKRPLRRPPGLPPGPLVTTAYYFLANTDFPLLVRTGEDGMDDVLELELNCEVDTALFTPPSTYKVTRHMDLSMPFAMQIRQTRQAPENRFTIVSTNTVTSDGTSVISSFVQTTSYLEGPTNTFGPKTSTNTGPGRLAFLNYPLEAPYWGAARKIGSETVLGFETEIYRSSPPLNELFWVVDHPIAGTFSLRRAVVSPDGDTETNEVVRLALKPR